MSSLTKVPKNPAWVWTCTIVRLLLMLFGKVLMPTFSLFMGSRSLRYNLKEKMIHFSGIKGQAIQQRYMDMIYDTMDKDGHVKTLPLFADIDVRCPKYTFSHPAGLLFAMQFAQIALVVTEKAAFEDMRVKGFVQKDCAFAGHSLGEYSALALIADVLHISALVDVILYWGITMQRAVEHDSENRSNYAMCAVNPSRVSTTFSDAALCDFFFFFFVDSIATHTASLLEIVNYNVKVILTFMTAIHFDFLCIYRVNNMSALENSLLCRL